MKIRVYTKTLIFLFMFFTLFFVSENSVYAIDFCGTRNVDPVNTGSPNPMKEIKGLGDTRLSMCGDEMYRISSDPTPVIQWDPELINWGTPQNWDGFTLNYRVQWFKINNINSLSCNYGWDDIDNSPNKFPQTSVGYTKLRSTYIKKGAGVPFSIFTPFNPPAHRLSEPIILQKGEAIDYDPENGIEMTNLNQNIDPLDPGVYQMDIIPSCDGGKTFLDGQPGSPGSVSIAATFLKVGCDAPGQPRNIKVEPSDKNPLELNINWDAPSPKQGKLYADVGRYEIYRRNNSSGQYFLLTSLPYTTTTYTDQTVLECNTDYTYKIRAIGCGSGEFSAPFTGKTGNVPSCTNQGCDIVRGSDTACMAPDEAYNFKVSVDGVMNTSLWKANVPGSFSKTADNAVNEVTFTPSQANVAQDVTITYGDTSSGLYCQEVLAMYPRGSIEVELREAIGGCENYKTSSQPLSDINVGASSGVLNSLHEATSNNGGVAILNNLQIKKSSELACYDVDYKVQIVQSTLSNAGVVLCEDSIKGTNWKQVPPNLSYDIPAINPDTGTDVSPPVFKTPVVYFEKVQNQQVSNWITINQGDFRVQSKYNPDGKTGDILIQRSGNIFPAQGYDLKQGILGPSQNKDNVNDYENYVYLKDFSEILNVLSEPESLVVDDCFNIPSEYNKGTIKLMCDAIVSNVNDNVSNYPVIFVDGDVTLSSIVFGDETTKGNFMYINGDLTINPVVREINMNLLVNGDVENLSSAGLINNGFLVSEATAINQLSRMNIRSDFRVFDNDVLKDLLSILVSNIYRVRID